MDHKILFVDDERSLLNGIQRLLGLRYNIETAESGEEGLEVIRDHGPFATIFTDMRMPRMDGVEFAKRARQAAPESTIVMLTGNQDLATAVRAVNEGHVFRFLNKPCETEELELAISDATRHFELVSHEKELLHKTFVGSVKVLSDVIEIGHPELAGRTESVERRVNVLREAAGVDDRWEFKLAGRLSLLGLALLPDTERLRFERSEHDSPFAHDTLVRAASITSKLIRDIPRLGAVAKICEHQESSSGQIVTHHPATPDEVTVVGAALLRAAMHWDCLSRQRLTDDEVSREMSSVVPGLPKELLNVIGDGLDDEPDSGCVELPASMLEEGMVAASDLTTVDGAVLLRRGRRLSPVMIERLQYRDDLKPIEITAASAKLDAPCAAAST